MSMTTTPLDLGTVVHSHPVFYQDDTLTATGATTFKAGTVLARNTTTKKLVPFVVGGTATVNGTPSAVLVHEVVAGAAGDLRVRPLIEGKVYKDRLVIAADGDASNVDAVVKDQLRVYGIIAVESVENYKGDNQ